MGTDWQAFTLLFSWGAAYAAGQGARRRRRPALQAIEIGGIEVISFGPASTRDMLQTQFTYADAAPTILRAEACGADRRDPEGRSRDRGRR